MRTHSFYILFFLFFFTFIYDTHAQGWEWSIHAGGRGSDYACTTVTDASGNLYVTGVFNSPSITFGTTTLLNPGWFSSTFSFYLLKYDSIGNLIWAKNTVSGSADPISMSIDQAGNIYITGTGSDAAFGSSTILTTGDMFIAKYDSTGNAIWAKSATCSFPAGSAPYVVPTSVNTDALGNTYVTGHYMDTINFGSISLNTGTSCGVAQKMFVVKYDSSGNLLWGRSDGSTYTFAYSEAIDQAGNIYVAGNYSGSSVFGSTTLSCSGTDMFLVKYDSAGDIIWAKNTGGSVSYCGATSITADAFGNIYVAGFFNTANVTFGATVLTNTDSGTCDLFIVKYDTAGSMLWASEAGGINNEDVTAITTNTTGDLYVSGIFNSSFVIIGADTLTNNSLNSQNIFLLKYNSSGDFIWARSAGGSNDDMVYSITTFSSESVYITGYFRSPTIRFGDSIFTNANPNPDLFFAKINESIPCTPTLSSVAISGPSEICIGSSITFSCTPTGGIWDVANSIASISGDGAVNGISTGTDIISITAYNGCSGTITATQSLTVNPCTTGVHSIPALIEDITIYPNPTQNYISVTSSAPIINSIVISNLLGLEVFSGSYNTNNAVVSMEQLPIGVYIIKINCDKVYKVVKE